ncbi:MAG: hypothetical protein NZ805_04790 [Armatimonadetes bacterium]|nr:hypothetical protein [Armatimonadota bacterium]MDW8027807.1 hypothetical protein [Armatimonadota bacterium]
MIAFFIGGIVWFCCRALEDAKVAECIFGLFGIRQLIDDYRQQHQGTFPWNLTI